MSTYLLFNKSRDNKYYTIVTNSNLGLDII